MRHRPITLKKILCTAFCAAVFFIQLISAYILGLFLFVITKPTPKKRELFHRYNCSVFRFDIKRMPGIRLIYKNDRNEKFEKPSVIICNHQSILDSFCMMFVTPKVVLLANEHIKMNPIVGTIFKWSNFFTVTEGSSNIIERLRPLIREGFSIAIFPEGERPEAGETSIKRFHKGAFHIADSLNLDIVPVYFNGILQIMPKGTALSNGGTMFIEVGKRISISELRAIGDLSEQAKSMRRHYKEQMARIHKIVSTVDELIPIVHDRYIYKGRDIEAAANKSLKALRIHAESIQGIQNNKSCLVMDYAGQGELAILLGIMYPEKEIYCDIQSSDTQELFKGCIQDFVRNVKIINEEEVKDVDQTAMNTFIVTDHKNNPSEFAPGTVIIMR